MDSLGDRIKNNYENRYRIKLTRRVPVILRLDGNCFHRLTKICCKKPFDENFSRTMAYTARELCWVIQGAKFAYVQSDEISILLTDFDRIESEAWFDYNLQKIVSISAGKASVMFSFKLEREAEFDSRAFNIPKEEVSNYFIWRQKDWIRNSVMMLAQSYYSHKELHKKSQSDMHEMLYQKGVNWADLPTKWKNGIMFEKRNEWCGWPAVEFTKERDVIERYLKLDE